MDNDRTTIKVLYTSDVHGSVLPISYGTNEQTDHGLAKYATIAKKVKQTFDHVLVLDNGDLIQGTPLMTHYIKDHANRTNPMVGIMNEIGIDAAVIGNHEFNFGRQVLESAVAESNFPWISANCVDETTGEPRFGPPYIIKELENGVRTAIVAVTTHYIPNWESPEHIEGLQFKDAFAELQKWVHHIHEVEQPDIVIAAYHGGFECDLQTGEPTEPLTGENQAYQMCEKISGIDVLLTGHQHRVLSDRVNDVVITQPGKDASYYGEITIHLSKDTDRWSIVDRQAEVKSLIGVPADEEVLQYIKPLEESTQQWLDQPVGQIDGDMSIADPFEARVKKHALIEFIQNVQMDATGVDISVTSLLNNETAGFDRVVTMRDIVANYMYPNTLVVLELSGADIIAALEKSATYFVISEDGEMTVNPAYISPKPQHYNYDMWEGIEYTINVGQPIGSRISDITFDGEPVQDKELYHVVLNNYRANGGGDYDMFKGKRVVKEVQKDAVELIHTYFEKHPVVKASVTPNFIVKK